MPICIEHLTDAMRWASKMDWGLDLLCKSSNKKMGSGNISIIQIKNTGEWMLDLQSKSIDDMVAIAK